MAEKEATNITENELVEAEELRKEKQAKKDKILKNIKKHGTRVVILGGVVGLSVGIYFIAMNNFESRDLTTVGGIIRDKVSAITTKKTTTVNGDKTYGVYFNKGQGIEISSPTTFTIHNASNALMNYISEAIYETTDKSISGWESSIELKYPQNSTVKTTKKVEFSVGNWYGISFEDSPLKDAKKSILSEEKVVNTCTKTTDENGTVEEVCTDIKKDAVLMYTTKNCGRGIFLDDVGSTIKTVTTEGVTEYVATITYLYYVTSYNQSLKLSFLKI